MNLSDKEIKPSGADFFFMPQWPVLYEDNHLLALYKPSGLLIQQDRTKDVSLIDLARKWLKLKYDKPGNVFIGMVHRLDRPVAGVVLFCKTSKGAGRVSASFRQGEVEKEYVAVAEGRLEKKTGRLLHHIRRRGSSSIVLDEPGSNSRKAALTYRVLAEHKNRTLVSIRLETGRHHQIRAQFAHIGHPLAGDLRYGAPAPLDKKQIALFAVRLSLPHPVKKTMITFSLPLPRGWPWSGNCGVEDSLFWNWNDVRDQVMEGFQGTS
ncbi:MAG: RluA family pseudouridine synthase [Deltaproteobacteria bacterium]|nr:RluA family pseudouridine synthase [Deltaproteobacteria bacterium]